MKPFITFGMAHYEDSKGLWATIRGIKTGCGLPPEMIEFVVVDTSPKGSAEREQIQQFQQKMGFTLVDSPITGTTYPRDLIFSHASGTWTCVVDCHICFPYDVIKKLVAWLEANPDCTDLLQGPILFDDESLATHFADQFRGGMWGTWSTGWETKDGVRFCVEQEVPTDSPLPRKQHPEARFYSLIDMEPLDLFDIPYARHQQALISLGCKPMYELDEPFDIPGQGLGCFLSRTDSWLGFAQGCSGFGGEEMNIHLKYRQAGRRTLCLPFFVWNHRFLRAGGPPYPMSLDSKIRNYALWARDLDDPMTLRGRLSDRIQTHFVDGRFPSSKWHRLWADPLRYPVGIKHSAPPPMKALDALFFEVANTKRDLDQHAERIRNTISDCESVCAYVKRVEWETFIAAGFPRHTTIYQTEQLPLSQRTKVAIGKQQTKNRKIIEKFTVIQTKNLQSNPPVQDVDCLIIDGTMSDDWVSKVIYPTRKYIILQGTKAYWEESQDKSGPGLKKTIEDFLSNNPGWKATHYQQQYGLTILCKQ